MLCPIAGRVFATLVSDGGTPGRRACVPTILGGQYSVPHRLLGQLLWVRVHGRGDGEAVIIVHR